MRIEARLEDGELRVSLDEATYMILERALPISKPYVEIMVGVVREVILILVAQGEERVMPYIERVRAGEDSTAVGEEMLRDFGIIPKEVFGMELPPLDLDTMREALGWRKEIGGEDEEAVNRF